MHIVRYSHWGSFLVKAVSHMIPSPYLCTYSAITLNPEFLKTQNGVNFDQLNLI